MLRTEFKSPFWGMVKSLLAVSVLAMPLSNVNAALLERLNGVAYYDTEANLTWLADANYAMTSGYDSDGYMDWVTANTWASSLTISGVSDWRLPTTQFLDSSCSNQTATQSWGYGCTSSEMGNLFYNVLGGDLYTSIDTTHNDNYDLFTNILTDSGYTYWSSTQYDSYRAWTFDFDNGHQGYTSFPNVFSAWLVHDGDVSASVVPVPAAVWLFCSGLLGLIGVARRHKHN